MQIDSAGNVVKPPKATLACNKIDACTKAGATALSKSGAAKTELLGIRAAARSFAP